MKKEYKNPVTAFVITSVSQALMASPYHDLVGGGNMNKLNVVGRKLYI